MFEASDVMFIYGISPVHMGAGTGLGAVDNPIQRERHTEHPVLAGSGLKGAMRHVAARGDRGMTRGEVFAIFGPATAEADKHAGALSIADAQIALFPVRSLAESYVYATCPTALARLARLAGIAGIDMGWEVPKTIEDDRCLVTFEPPITGDNKVVLESFCFNPRQDKGAAAIGSWLGERALPKTGNTDYFRQKIAKHLVVLHDDVFNHFVRHATVVEPHVRISDETGTADGGGLFYTESLPPESLLAALVMASRDRRSDSKLAAGDVLQSVRDRYNGSLLQIGGDATTGRGQVLISMGGDDA